MNKQAGVLIVLTGPSGVGKGVLRKQISEKMPWLKESVSVTTRCKRPEEQDGIDYFFITHDKFQDMIKSDDLIEWAEFAGNYYGTPRKSIEKMIANKHSILLEIEVNGALQIKKLFPEAYLVFIEPPSLSELENRLKKRGLNSDKEIQQRLQSAIKELEQKTVFDYIFVNDNMEECKQNLIKLIEEIILNKNNKQSFCST